MPEKDSASRRFQRVAALFKAAAVLPVAERAAFVRAQREYTGDIREEVLQLLQHDAADDLVITGILGFVENDARAVEADDRDAATPTHFGDLRVVRRLGEGGMGSVFLCEQPVMDRRVAVKVMHPGALLEPRARERFYREALATARLKHPGVVQIHTLDQQDGVHYLAMEWIEGRTLRDLLDALRARGPRETWDGSGAAEVLTAGGHAPTPGAAALYAAGWLEFVLRVGVQAGEALAYSHARGVIHRDVKPGNLMLDANGRVVLLDFGIAKLTDAGVTALTRPGGFAGSLPYMSPEQLSETGAEVDARTDVYSLAVSLCEMLGGRHPFAAGTTASTRRRILDGRVGLPLGRLRPRLPPDVITVLRQGMAPDVRDRYQDMASFVADLRNLLELRPIAATKPTSGMRILRYTQRHPAQAAAVCLSLCLVLGVPLTYLLAASDSRARLAEETRRAESREQETLQTIDAVLTDFADQRMLNLPGGTELRLQMLASATERLRALERAGGSSAAVRLHLAMALTRLGKLQAEVGIPEKGIPVLESAITILDALDDTPGLEVARADAWCHHGRALVLVGRLEAARRRLEQAVEAVRPLSGNVRLTVLVEAQLELGRIGVILGDAEAMKEHLDAAHAALSLVPEGAYRQLKSMRLHGLRGFWHAAGGRRAEALEEATQARREGLAILERTPGHVVARRWVANAELNMAALHYDGKRTAEARQLVAAGLQRLKEVDLQFPGKRSTARDHIGLRLSVLRAQLRNKERGDGLALAASTMRLVEASNDAAVQRELGLSCRVLYAVLLQETGEGKRALDLMRTAHEQGTRLEASAQKILAVETSRDLAFARNALVRKHVDEGDLEGARGYYEACSTAAARVLARGPDASVYMSLILLATRLSTAHLNKGDHDRARTMIETARRHAEEFATQLPGPRAALRLGDLRHAEALVLWQCGDRDRALTLMEEIGARMPELLADLKEKKRLSRYARSAAAQCVSQTATSVRDGTTVLIDARQCVRLVKIVGRLHASLRDDGEIPPPQKRGVTSTLVRDCTEVLRHAFATGSPDATGLVTDPALASLVALPRFRRAVESLGPRAK